MKLMIDISDKDYEKLKDGHIPFSILDVMQNGTPISDNATNGDVIKALFPKVEFYDMAFTVHATTKVTSNGVKGGISYDFWKEWWNAPYKAESEK